MKPSAVRRAALAGACLFFAAFFTFDIWSSGRVFGWFPVRLAADLLVFGLLGGWMGSLVLTGRTLSRGLLDAPLAAVAGVAILSAVAAKNPAAASEPLLQLAIMALWFKLLEQQIRTRPGLRDHLLALFLLASVGVAIQVLWTFAVWYAGSPGQVGHEVSWLGTGAGLIPPVLPQISSPLGPTAAGGYLGMLIPPAIGALMQARSVMGRLLVAGWIVLSAFALVLVQSRAGWLAAGSGCLVFLALLASRRLPGNASLTRTIPLGFLGLAALALLVAVALLTVVSRSSPTMARLFIWGDALRIWWQHPLLGVGPGNYVMAQLEQRPDAPLDSLFLQAHNLPVHFLAVVGLAGLAAVGWLAISAAAASVRAWRGARAGRGVVAGCLAGVAGFVAWNLADVQTYSFALWGTAAALIVLATSVEQLLPLPAGDKAARPYRLLQGVAVASLGLAFVLLERDHLVLHQANDLAQGARQEEAALLLREAASASTSPAFLESQIGLLEARQGQWERADAAYKALGSSHGWPTAIANAAHVAARNGNVDRAVGLAQTAARMAPQEAHYPLLLGRLYEQSGQRPDAVQAYGRALALQPLWVQSDFWQGPVRQQLLADALEAALSWVASDPDLVTTQRALMKSGLFAASGRFDEAIAAASQGLDALSEVTGAVAQEVPMLLTGQVRDVGARERALFSRTGGPAALQYQLGVAAAGRNDRAAAKAAFEAAIQLAPAFPGGHLGASMVARLEGDHELAVREAAIAVIYGGDREAAAALGKALLEAGQPREAILHLEAGARPTRRYSPQPGLLLYQRREVLPNLLPEILDLAPDRDLDATLRDLAAAYRAVGNEEGEARVAALLARTDPIRCC